MDVAHSSSLLADHGAGTGRCARLEGLIPEHAPSYVDLQHHVVHGQHGSASGSVHVHGSSTVPAHVHGSSTVPSHVHGSSSMGCVPPAPDPRLELARPGSAGSAGTPSPAATPSRAVSPDSPVDSRGSDSVSPDAADGPSSPAPGYVTETPPASPAAAPSPVVSAPASPVEAADRKSVV